MNQEQKPPNPNGITDETFKALSFQYQDWIEHKGTQDLLKLLKTRKEYYEKTLTDHILKKSDKEIEDKLRSAISTCEAILRIVSDCRTFIEFTTQKPNT